MVWTKADLINELALIRGYRTYLEICTPSTGGLYAAVDRTRYTCHRLMYRYPAKFMDKLVYMVRFEDKMSIDFRTSQLDIADCVQAMQARGLKYDVILVDAFHGYRESARDIAVAVDRLSPGGTIVLHDCFPRDSALAVPNFIRGGWCGVTYKAYLDFVLSRKDLDFCTIDTDYGCGVIRLNGADRSLPRPAERATAPEDRDRIVERWMRLGDDYVAAFKLLMAHSGALLNLVTVEEFLAAERHSTPALV